jgi:hypothetical protein
MLNPHFAGTDCKSVPAGDIIILSISDLCFAQRFTTSFAAHERRSPHQYQQITE